MVRFVRVQRAQKFQCCIDERIRFVDVEKFNLQCWRKRKKAEEAVDKLNGFGAREQGNAFRGGRVFLKQVLN